MRSNCDLRGVLDFAAPRSKVLEKLLKIFKRQNQYPRHDETHQDQHRCFMRRVIMLLDQLTLPLPLSDRHVHRLLNKAVDRRSPVGPRLVDCSVRSRFDLAVFKEVLPLRRIKAQLRGVNTLVFLSSLRMPSAAVPWIDFVVGSPSSSAIESGIAFCSFA